jgi:flavodoxin
MKRISVLIMLAAKVCLASSCSTAQQPSVSSPQPADKQILIVYLSRTNNTKAIAQFIHENVGGTLVPLELEKPYPENYEATVQQVAKENETGYLPSLKTKISDIEKIRCRISWLSDVGMQLSSPMKSFLTQHSLKGKKVIPFNTNAGYGEGSSFRTVRELCPDSTILDGFITQGGSERD